MNHSDVVEQIVSSDRKIILLYAFNTTGKTRLSVAFKDKTKANNGGSHAGVYYNAFSEDLFVWDNDTANNEENIKLTINSSSLNQFHASLTEDAIRGKLTPYNFNFDFEFNLYEDDPEKGIESISFFVIKKDESTGEEEKVDIKISRGEERIFVWCFFLALFEVEGWADQQNEHFFIDDPVSSLDDHNIFITALSIMNLIENYSGDRKIIITSHHIGFFSILANWLTKGEKSGKYKDISEIYILSKKEDGSLFLESPRRAVFLYHLHLLQVLHKAKEEDTLVAYHFVLLRQLLENIASFMGVGRFGYVLEKIGVKDVSHTSNRLNVLSHKNIFTYEGEVITPDNKQLIIEILEKLQNKFDFKIP